MPLNSLSATPTPPTPPPPTTTTTTIKAQTKMIKTILNILIFIVADRVPDDPKKNQAFDLKTAAQHYISKDGTTRCFGFINESVCL